MYLLKVGFSFLSVICCIGGLHLGTNSVSLGAYFFIPTPARYGSTIQMICDYHIPDNVFKSSGWYKDGKMVYGWNRETDNVHFVDREGIHIDLLRSNNHSLVLEHVTEASSGKYECLVKSMNPLLGVVKWGGNLTVLPENLPMECSGWTEMLWETLKEDYPEVVRSIPNVPERLNCVHKYEP